MQSPNKYFEGNYIKNILLLSQTASSRLEQEIPTKSWDIIF
jgi:hypothetical protein